MKVLYICYQTWSYTKFKSENNIGASLAPQKLRSLLFKKEIYIVWCVGYQTLMSKNGTFTSGALSIYIHLWKVFHFLLSLFPFFWMCYIVYKHALCCSIWVAVKHLSLIEVNAMACSECMLCQCRSGHVTVPEGRQMLLISWCLRDLPVCPMYILSREWSRLHFAWHLTLEVDQKLANDH